MPSTSQPTHTILSQKKSATFEINMKTLQGWIVFSFVLGFVHSYEVGCIYPENMLDPFAARNKLIGFTNVYNAEGTTLETPIAIHQGQGFSYCDVLCLAYHDEGTLHAMFGTRPVWNVPSFGQNSWSRMMCIAQCYAILFAQEGNVEAVQTVVDTWKLPIQSEIEEEITTEDSLNDIAAYVQEYVELNDYDPLIIGRMVAHEVNVFMKSDGWNMDGSLVFDWETGEPTECTSNCMPYADTYGYIVKNPPGLSLDLIRADKYNVSGNLRYWQPLLEDNGLGYFSRQEHVTPHIGYNAKFRLRDPAAGPSVEDPNYDYYDESLQVVERLRLAASNASQWDKIIFYDKKYLVRLLIQNSMKVQLKDSYRFEDELLFVHGISAAEYDSVLHAWRAKVQHDLVRPTTVIQNWGSDVLVTYKPIPEGSSDANSSTAINRAEDAEFESDLQRPVGSINSRDFQAFVRVMPHSEFPSGSSCICTAYAEFTDAFTKMRFDNNTLQNMFWGYGGIDLGCSEYSPEGDEQAESLGCKHGGFNIPDMQELAIECGQTRLWGGMHFPASVSAGHELCSGLGTLGLELIQNLQNNSSMGGDGAMYVQGDERPQCSTWTESPTKAPVDDGTWNLSPSSSSPANQPNEVPPVNEENDDVPDDTDVATLRYAHAALRFCALLTLMISFSL